MRLQRSARFWTILATAGVLLAAGADAPVKSKARSNTPAPLPPLNEKVVGFAREHVGKKVDNGQCTSLAIEALRYE